MGAPAWVARRGRALRRPPSVIAMEVGGGIVAVIAGTLLHFTYGWTAQNPVVALFAPVNESVWEHGKLLFFPAALVGMAEAWWIEDAARLLWAKLVGATAGLLFVFAFFYTYTGALGVESLGADIASFVAAVVLCQWLSQRILRGRGRVPWAGVSAVALGLLAIAFMVWSYLPPQLPLFRSAVPPEFGLGP